MKSRIFATLAVATVLAVGVSAPAFAAQSYTGALSANSAAPGGSVQYTSDNTGQPDGTTGTYSLSSSQSGALGGASAIQLASSVSHAVQVGAHSHLTFTVKVPKSAKPGSTYTLAVKAGKFSDSQSITIVGVPASAASSNGTALWIAVPLVLLIVLAFIIVLFARRRSKAAQ